MVIQCWLSQDIKGIASGGYGSDKFGISKARGRLFVVLFLDIDFGESFGLRFF